MDVFDRPDGVTVIDDSYNANPASTAAALHALAAIGPGPAAVAVLGYLAELGEYERDGHEQVGRLAAELGVDRLVVVGEPAAPIHDGAVAVANWGGESVLVTDQDGGRALLRGELRPGRRRAGEGLALPHLGVADALRDDAGAGAAGRRRVRAVIVAAAVAFLVSLFGTPLGDPGLHPAQGRPADPRRRARRPTWARRARRPWAASSSSSPR